MTEQEKEIQRVVSYIRSCRNAGIDTTITIGKSRNHFILNALEEIQRYREIGTVEECREAIHGEQPGQDVEELAAYICDKLCRHSYNNNLTQDELEEICEKCYITKIAEASAARCSTG